MGLGPMMAIYQARFMKYLHDRGLANTGTARSGPSWATARWTSPSRWARSRSPAASASTTWSSSSTATCSVSTGPVRGNGKIIQELEAVFRGAGWNVIKVIWGR
jgi:pyruvate dehydrogenase E1 component